MFWKRVLAAVALTAVLVLYGVGAGGCQSKSAFTKEEERQLREGPPPEMPPQAREAMERMRQGGGNVPPPPPRPAGQPGPGAPVAPR